MHLYICININSIFCRLHFARKVEKLFTKQSDQRFELEVSRVDPTIYSNATRTLL